MYRKFIRRTLIAAVSLLLCWALMVGILDPFFHYHAPWFDLEPVVDNERYQNPGIAEHFAYDSVILGSSMAENFRASWFDQAFDCSAVKLTYSAARTGNYDWMLKKAFATREIENVFLCLDNDSLCLSGYGEYFFPIPEYLYDENPLNDVEYLLDLSVLEPAWDLVWENVQDRVEPLEDAYVWDEPGIYGREKALASVDWDMERISYQKDVSRYLENCRENVEKNLLPHIRQHPETTFYVFFPPYSILCWNKLWNSGQLDARLDVISQAAELLLPCENVKLFYFHNVQEVVCDLDNYKDYNHYSAEVSRLMVDWLRDDAYRMTAENSEAFLEGTREMTLQYDYAGLKQ